MKKTRMEGDGGDGDGSSRVHGFCEVKEMGESDGVIIFFFRCLTDVGKKQIYVL